MIKKLKHRWGITSSWQVVVILVVFAVTGSSSMFVTRPLFELLGIVKTDFSQSTGMLILYYTIRVLVIFVAYQILLLMYGWLFGQFNFFWNFVKKMLVRLGFGFLKNH